MTDDFNIGPVFHGTGVKVQKFRTCSHFGTEKAARQRLKDPFSYRGKTKRYKNLYLIEAKLSIKNPAFFCDNKESHGPSELVANLHDCHEFERSLKRFGVSSKEFLIALHKLEGARYFAPLVRLLESRGIDGLKYRNAHEDFGSISWIVFHPAQVKIENTIFIDNE